MLYYYPNKPILVPPGSDIIREKSEDPDWWSEIKKNGTRLGLKKDQGTTKLNFGDFVFWNRHKEVLKYYPCPELLEELHSFRIPNGTHIDAELLHHKTKLIKNFIYVYDIYLYKGEEVLETLEVRRKMIEDIFGGQYKHFQLSEIYPDKFEELFNSDLIQKNPENEGLVMKSKHGKIQWSLKTCLDVGWQIKVRKPSGSYHF